MSPRDAALLDRWIRSRDAEALASLVSYYENMVFAAAVRVLGDEDKARDAAQECFVRLAFKPPKSTEYLGGWLHRVVTNIAIDTKRRVGRSSERERKFAQQQGAAFEPDWDDIQHFIDEAIEELPNKTRQMVIAHFLQKKSHAEIATEFRISKQAVTRRIANGIESLRKTLARAGVTLSAGGLVALLTANAVRVSPAALAVAVVAAIKSAQLTASLGGSGAPAVLSAKVFAAIAAAAALLTTGIFFMGDRTSDARDRTATDEPPTVASVESSTALPTSSVLEVSSEGGTRVAQAESSVATQGWSGRVRDAVSGEILSGIPVEIRRRVAITHRLTQTDKLPNLTGDNAASVASIQRDLNLIDTTEVPLPTYVYALDLELEWGSPLLTVLSDENGSVSIASLPPGEYVATVDTPEFATIGRAPFPIEGMGVARVEVGSVFTVHPGVQSSIDVEIQRKAVVRGRVYDHATGTGVAGVAVQIRQTTPNHQIVNVPMGEAHTDHNGDFEISNVRPGDCVVWRSDVDGYVGGPALVKRIHVAPGATVQSVDFPLSTGGLLAGTVRIGDELALNTPFDILGIPTHEDLSKNTNVTVRILDQPISTDGNGQYVVSGVDRFPAVVVGQFRLDSGQTHHSYPLRASLDVDGFNELDLNFPWGPGVLHGIVTGDDGRPLGNAIVIKFVHGDPVAGRSQVTTDASGRFRIDGIEEGVGDLWVFYPLTYLAVVLPMEFHPYDSELDIVVPFRNGIEVSCLNVPPNSVSVVIRAYRSDWEPDYSGTPAEIYTRMQQNALTYSRYFAYYREHQRRCRVIGLGAGSYTLLATSYPADAGSAFYYEGEQRDRFLHETRVVRKVVTVTGSNPSPEVNFDFAESVSWYEAGRGASP